LLVSRDMNARRKFASSLDLSAQVVSGPLAPRPCHAEGRGPFIRFRKAPLRRGFCFLRSSRHTPQRRARAIECRNSGGLPSPLSRRRRAAAPRSGRLSRHSSLLPPLQPSRVAPGLSPNRGRSVSWREVVNRSTEPRSRHVRGSSIALRGTRLERRLPRRTAAVKPNHRAHVSRMSSLPKNEGPWMGRACRQEPDDRGGHFAAWEEPEVFSSEVRAAFRWLR
jgi:hypothetical protein